MITSLVFRGGDTEEIDRAGSNLEWSTGSVGQATLLVEEPLSAVAATNDDLHTERSRIQAVFSLRLAALQRSGARVNEFEIAHAAPARASPDATLAPDLVQRDFTAPEPNRLWVTDLTMVPTHEGPLWLSAIRDAFSRRVAAWETSARADADLVLTTLEYALASRVVEPGELIHHADHGTQYTSSKLTTRLVRAGIQASMGSVGDSYDNALAENLWMLIKTECVRGRVFATRAEANLALFKYLDDGFYNPCRIQKRLGYLSPVEYEEKHYANQATAEPVNLKPRQPALTS